MVDVIEGRYILIFSFKEACEGPLAFRIAPCPIFFVIITDNSNELAVIVKFFVAGKLKNYINPPVLMIDLRVVTESEVFFKQSNDALELTGFE